MALRLRGATSGYIELKAPASAGDNTLTLPTNNGGANQLLKIDGSGNLSWQTNLTFDGNNLEINGSPPWTVTGGNWRNLSISGEGSGASGFLWLGNGAAATNADFDLARINMCNGATIVAQIAGSTQTGANDDGRLTFSTKKTTGSLKERLRIDSSGNLTAVNTDSGGQSVTLELGASNASGVNDGVIKIVNGGTGNGVIQWNYESHANRAQIYVYRSTQELIFTVGGNERARITDDGIKLPANKGINFSAYATAASGSGSPDPSSNLLDDYEQGTFTPTIRVEGQGSNVVTDVQVGIYTKIGNKCTVWVELLLNGAPAGTGANNAWEIRDFPFTSTNINDFHAIGSARCHTLAAGSYGSDIVLIPRIWSATSYGRMEAIDQGDYTVRNASTYLQDNTSVMFTITYCCA